MKQFDDILQFSGHVAVAIILLIMALLLIVYLVGFLIWSIKLVFGKDEPEDLKIGDTKVEDLFNKKDH